MTPHEQLVEKVAMRVLKCQVHQDHDAWDAAKDILALILSELHNVTPEMQNNGAHVSSEWLDDDAPLRERRHKEPAKNVFRAMLAASPLNPEGGK